VLGEHATEEEAKAQENAINIAKARAAGHQIPKKDCYRIDRGELKKPVKMPNGFLKADAFPHPHGHLPLPEPDGTERRELRLPEEVFRKDVLDSFSLAPITDDHPPEFLTTKNARKYARGALSDSVTRDGDFVRGSMLVTDAELIDKMQSGEAQGGQLRLRLRRRRDAGRDGLRASGTISFSGTSAATTSPSCRRVARAPTRACAWTVRRRKCYRSSARRRTPLRRSPR
jgi:hypothetical protein